MVPLSTARRSVQTFPSVLSFHRSTADLAPRYWPRGQAAARAAARGQWRGDERRQRKWSASELVTARTSRRVDGIVLTSKSSYSRRWSANVLANSYLAERSCEWKTTADGTYCKQ